MQWAKHRLGVRDSFPLTPPRSLALLAAVMFIDATRPGRLASGGSRASANTSLSAPAELANQPLRCRSFHQASTLPASRCPE